MKIEHRYVVMSFVLIRIIMSLFPFVKEALHNYRKKSKTYIVLVLLVVLLTFAFFLQADIIKQLYEKNREYADKLEQVIIELDNLGIQLDESFSACEKETARLNALIATQNHLLKLCPIGPIGEDEETGSD